MAFLASYENILSIFINKILIAAIIVFMGFISARIISKLSLKFLKKIQLDRITGKIGLKVSVEELISYGLLYVIDIIVIIIALMYINFAKSVISVLSIIFIVIIIIFITLSIKDFIPNMIAGIILQQRGTIKPGDILEIGEIKGRVTIVSLLDTRIETKRGDIIIIPNSNFSKKTYKKLKRL